MFRPLRCSPPCSRGSLPVGSLGHNTTKEPIELFRYALKYYRNIYCWQYDRCLNRAAKAGKSFCCRGCEREYERNTFELDIHDLQGCLNLIRIIFNKDGRARSKKQKDYGGLPVMELGSIETIIPRID